MFAHYEYEPIATSRHAVAAAAGSGVSVNTQAKQLQMVIFALQVWAALGLSHEQYWQSSHVLNDGWRAKQPARLELRHGLGGVAIFNLV
jgi:hypothetical protein